MHPSSSLLEPIATAPAEAGQPPSPLDPLRQDATRLTGWLVALALFATVLKLACAALTLGTNDVPTFYNFMLGLRTMSVGELYRATVLFNHTPLVASYLRFLDAVTHGSIREFAFFVRLPGILADLVMALFMIIQRRQEPLASCPTWALALFIASPLSFLVSGFHGNFDSAVVPCVFLSAWMCVRERPLLSALFLALSLQIKVPAMIVLPVFLVYWYRRGALLRFASTLGLGCLLGWTEALVEDPRVFIHNVFGYNSYWGSWGISYWLVHTFFDPFTAASPTNPTLLVRAITLLMKIAILSGGAFLAWTQRPFTAAKFFPTLAVTWSVFFFLTPGAGVQYLVWLAPFVLLYHPRWYLGLTVCSTVFGYFFYRIICHSWWLYYGKSTGKDYWYWGPWMLWAWVASSYGLYLYWSASRSAPGSPMQLVPIRCSEPT